MANWYGTARSNYVRVKDVQAAREALEKFDNQVHIHPQKPDYLMVSGGSDSGGFNTSTWGEDDEDIELDWREWAIAHLCEGQVLWLVEAGAEKLRYVSAWAAAFTADGREAWVNLDSAICQAMQSVGIDPATVATPTYMETR